MLRAQVLQSMDENGWQFLAVTSPTTGCGKSVTAINLALSVARQSERSVFLVDMDLQRPKIADYLTSISKLIVVATFDLPGWVSLGFDLSRMPTADRFQRECKNAVGPIHAMNEKITLPEGSYRAASAKSAATAKLK